MEIKRLVKIDLLEPVTEPTEWVNSYVTVERIFLRKDISNSYAHILFLKKTLRFDSISMPTPSQKVNFTPKIASFPPEKSASPSPTPQGIQQSYQGHSTQIFWAMKNDL